MDGFAEDRQLLVRRLRHLIAVGALMRKTGLSPCGKVAIYHVSEAVAALMTDVPNAIPRWGRDSDGKFCLFFTIPLTHKHDAAPILTPCLDAELDPIQLGWQVNGKTIINRKGTICDLEQGTAVRRVGDGMHYSIDTLDIDGVPYSLKFAAEGGHKVKAAHGIEADKKANESWGLLRERVGFAGRLAHIQARYKMSTADMMHTCKHLRVAKEIYDAASAETKSTDWQVFKALMAGVSYSKTDPSP